jgi:hypothetical protein
MSLRATSLRQPKLLTDLKEGDVELEDPGFSDNAI